MKTTNVSEATNIQLDWLVAKCEGHDVVVLTIQEQRDRWFEDVPPENLEKEIKEYDLYFAPTVKPEIRIASEGGYKRTPHHSEALMLYGEGVARFQYSTSWSQMGPIIEQEAISIIRLDDISIPDVNGCWRGKYQPAWGAVIAERHSLFENYGSQSDYFGLSYHVDEDATVGPTPLIAAARCYIVSKLGQMVEVPEELA